MAARRRSVPPEAEPSGAARRGRSSRLRRLKVATVAVADAAPDAIESAVRQLGDSRRWLAPVAWAAGTIVLLIRGIKLLFLNWRLTLVELVPAAWVWLVMWDLKQHALRGSEFRQVTIGGIVLLGALAVGASIAAFWCNTGVRIRHRRPHASHRFRGATDPTLSGADLRHGSGPGGHPDGRRHGRAAHRDHVAVPGGAGGAVRV